jgi:hypothetical protein
MALRLKKYKEKHMENSKPTQAQRVLDYIKEFGSITQLEALRDIGVMRLASRVSELKKSGHKIVGEVISVSNRWGEKCHVKRYTFAETCVICGEIIPEGRQVCPKCERSRQ